MMPWYSFQPYVPVAARRAQARREMEKLRRKGKSIEPVEIEGRTITCSFWGKGWCEHLESFSDFENRLPRGRTYVRNGSVCHLDIQPGKVEAIVSGSELYQLDIRIAKLKAGAWKSIKRRCAGQIGSMLELLQGRVSNQVMAVVTDREQGLFPRPCEITFDCSCPDFAYMCKHVAAALYGIGHRLDSAPELLFTLRGVDPQELIASEIHVPRINARPGSLADDQLSEIFGIDLDEAARDHADHHGSAGPAAGRTTGKRRATNGRQRLAKKSHVARRRSPHAEVIRNNDGKHKTNRAESALHTTTRAAANTPRSIKGTSSIWRKTKSAGNGSDHGLPNVRPTGQSIARLRAQAGYSVAKFAEEVGVSPATVYRWESTAGRLRLHSTPHTAIARLHKRIHKA